MAEILPHHLMGPVMVGNMLFFMSGILINGILSFDDILATPELWPAITGELSDKFVRLHSSSDRKWSLGGRKGR